MSPEKATQLQAGVRLAESQTFRCAHCQHFTGGGCLLVEGSLGSNDVCDLFSGHQRFN